jgi:hypothetical protein
MNSRTSTAPHGQFEIELAELALGLLHERAALLEHVSSCEGCTSHLRDLETVAGTLLLLAPEAEVPIGFERRVLDMIQNPTASGESHRGPRPCRVGQG